MTEPYQLQRTARMTVVGAKLRLLPYRSVVVRCDTDANPLPDVHPLILIDPPPSVVPYARFLVLWSPTPPAAELVDVHPTDEFTVEEALRLEAAYDAIPRASCIAHTLGKEVRRLARVTDAQAGELRLQRKATAAEFRRANELENLLDDMRTRWEALAVHPAFHDWAAGDKHREGVNTGG